MTILGWSPAVARVLGSGTLACGCLVGRYGLRGGAVVTVIDSRAPGCAEPAHLPNACLSEEPRPA